MQKSLLLMLWSPGPDHTDNDDYAGQGLGAIICNGANFPGGTHTSKKYSHKACEPSLSFGAKRYRDLCRRQHPWIRGLRGSGKEHSGQPGVASKRENFRPRKSKIETTHHTPLHRDAWPRETRLSGRNGLLRRVECQARVLVLSPE